MYSVPFYGRMIADAPRMDAYVSALRHAVKPGSVVVDLGSGPGLFALLACKFGARRVYAIEPDKVIQVGIEAARTNGIADRVEFIQDFSTRVDLPEKADVVISDLRGVLPWFQHHLSAIVDARQRFLAPDGVLIPERDHLWASIVEAPELYDKLVSPWDDSRYGVSLAAGRKLVTNSWSKARLTEAMLLADPVNWQTIDYYQTKSADVSAELSFDINRTATAYGLGIWFDAELSPGICFSNSPAKEELIYGNAFFPFTDPVDVDLNDKIQVNLRADLVNDDYVWTWKTRIYNPGDLQTVKAEFQQSTLFGTPLSLSQFRKRTETYIPTQTEEARISSFILSRMDGINSVTEIAVQTAKEFPLRFPDSAAALPVVAELSSKFSE